MDISCVLSALLFFTGNLLLIIFYAKEANRSHFDYDTYVTLDPDYIQKEWDFRIQHKPKFLAAGIINALAWFFFAFPIIQLAWILSQRGAKSLWLHIAIAILALAGSFTEWISRFLYIGASMATELLVTDFNLDNWISSNSQDFIGWRTLEVTHIVTSGLILFIDAFEWICLSVILILVHISVRRWRVHDSVTFGACWNSIGLFIALLCLLDFVAEILRLDGFKLFGQIAFWYAAANRLVLLPLWLLMLGCRLPYAAMKLNEPTSPNNNESPIVIDAQTEGTR
jgi:hypothetical protein